MPAFILDSTHFDLLRVSGADAARFLQGQVTCDVDKVADGQCVLGAACNNKGRVIAPFLLKRSGQDFLLFFAAGLSAAFVTALRKFLPFYKCSMALARALICIGISGPAVPALLTAASVPLPLAGEAASHSGMWITRIPGDFPQFLACGDATALEPLTGSDLTRDEGIRWQAACLRNGHFPFAANDSEVYTPQELHYEQHQYVSFTKGCYTGQEIVARMHYRGKIKKQFFRLETASKTTSVSASIEVLGADGQVLASCIKVTHLPEGGTVALALLPVEILPEHATLQLSTGAMAAIHPF